MRLYLYPVTAFLPLILMTAFNMQSQENAIKFNLLPIESSEMPEAVTSTIGRKIATALNRSNAMTENAANVFAIRPEIVVTDAAESEGMIREVARVSAELTISAFNTVDGTVYHSATIPLKGSATGGKQATMKALANSMKATDPAYVRFVRTARNRINDYYAENCGNIIEEARKLMILKRYEEAASYLTGVPSSVSCYDQSKILLEEIAPYLFQAPDTVVMEHIVEVPVEIEPDTVVVEKVVERPVIVREPAVPVENKIPSTNKPKIIIDGTELDFDIIGCTGDLSRGRITITARITNRKASYPKPYVVFNTAITDSGNELNGLIKSTNYRSGNISMPDGVPVTVVFEITGVKERYASLSYMEISVRAIKVSIYNLVIDWQ